MEFEMILQVLFCVIAAASFSSNLFFCIVLVTKRSMLKKSHNIVLFSLAVTDLLTGECMLFITYYWIFYYTDGAVFKSLSKEITR